MAHLERTLQPIPARKLKVEFTFVRKDFAVINDNWRRIRAKARNPMVACFWCKKDFENGESIALAARAKKANVVLCHSCADTALKSVQQDG